jgi:hypothetical protein
LRVEMPQALRFALSDRYSQRRSTKEVRRSHHASDAEACLRQLKYKWDGVEPDMQMRESMAMQMGNAAETGFASDILHGGLYGSEIEEQHKVTFPIGAHDIVGFIDFLIEMPHDEWKKFFPQYERGPFPVEVKSLKTSLYEDSVTKGPFGNHLGQLNIYTCIMGSPFGVLMYVQREAVESIPFNLWLVPPDHKRFELVQKRLKRLEQYMEMGITPPPLCKQTKLDFRCPWHKSTCPHDGGWPSEACPICGGPLTVETIGSHADCIFGGAG